ncbi:helix-turn-helix domain-containing protein [Pedobacter frigidisoli]|uniref:winged helix-turn-helix transcriptional regulator n=1 Tax=Pedobacter frigidisoli TaxID=2530455 RepID=UPI00292F6A00|nr:helix-turn-helix domain-containing protein [Pedobacter frigidisoli]
MEQMPFSECLVKIRAIDDTMELLNGKWKISIIARLCYKPMRYSELLKNLNGISGKMLSRELHELEINGVVNREVASTKPLAVNYSVTEYGMSLKQLTDTIADWGIRHRNRILSDI